MTTSRYDSLSPRARQLMEDHDIFGLAEIAAAQRETETTVRVNYALYRLAEDTVTRVIELAERWQNEPARTDALAELRAALLSEDPPAALRGPNWKARQ